MNKSIIEFKDIYKNYNNISILKNFNIKIYKGDFITVIGTSGSGKTTLLKMINKLIEPDSGKILINDIEISEHDIYELRRSIGYVIQGAGLMPHLNVQDNINYVPNLISKNKLENINRAKKLIKYVNLKDEVLLKYPEELSGGQQQRVGIARALANNPFILLMDEPFGAVDEITRRLLQNEILQLHKEVELTIFFITHDIKEAFLLGTKILIIDKGQVVQFGTRDDIVKNPSNEFVEELLKDHINKIV